MQNTQSTTRVDNKWRVTPAMDVYENEEAYLLVGDLPGVAPPQLELKVEHGVLILDTTGVDPSWEYHRELRLSDDVDTDAIDARLDAGVLELRLPKRAETRSRKVVVHT